VPGLPGHGPEIETLWNEDRVATAEGEEVLAPGREAVDPVLAIPVRDEDIAVRRLDRMGRHVERLAVGARLALGADRQQHLAGRRVFGDGVEAGVSQVNLAGRVDPDPMGRGSQVAPAANLVPIPVEHQDVPDTAQDVTDRAVLAGVADAGVDPSPRVDADIRDCAADLHFGPMLHHFVLIVPESDALRHGSPPTVGGAVSSLHASGSLVSIPGFVANFHLRRFGVCSLPVAQSDERGEPR
jgi:hypothetical protein